MSQVGHTWNAVEGATMTDTIGNGRTGGLSDRSTADLVRLASEQISRLVRDELRLAQAELAEKGKHAGLGIGLFGGGGVVMVFGVGALTAAGVLALALVMPAWLAAVAVGAALFVFAAVLALVGRSQLRRAVPPMPEDAVRNVKADIGAVAEAVRDRGNGR
jgi:uncharacterized membrane protein YqjE